MRDGTLGWTRISTGSGWRAGHTCVRVSIATSAVALLSLSFFAAGLLVVTKVTALSAVYAAVLYALGEITPTDFGLTRPSDRVNVM